MSRVDELQKKYPTIPRDMIVKWEVLRNGVRYTDVVDKVSHHDHGLLYQSRDYDVTLRNTAKERSGAVRPGFVLCTSDMYLKS